MQLRTTRFGELEVPAEDVLHFASGLIGLETCQDFVLLADAQNEALGWLQSIARPEIALPVVSPRRFLPGYQFRVYKSELAPLELPQVRDAQVLAVIGRSERGLTMNLKAPLVINLPRGLGRQVIANGDQPVQYELAYEPAPLKKSA